jgi:hypothetical protein
VHADGDPARARVDVVARQAALPTLVERALRRQRERVRRDHEPVGETGAQLVDVQ